MHRTRLLGCSDRNKSHQVSMSTIGGKADSAQLSSFRPSLTRSMGYHQRTPFFLTEQQWLILRAVCRTADEPCW